MAPKVRSKPAHIPAPPAILPQHGSAATQANMKDVLRVLHEGKIILSSPPSSYNYLATMDNVPVLSMHTRVHVRRLTLDPSNPSPYTPWVLDGFVVGKDTVVLLDGSKLQRYYVYLTQDKSRLWFIPAWGELWPHEFLPHPPAVDPYTIPHFSTFKQAYVFVPLRDVKFTVKGRSQTGTIYFKAVLTAIRYAESPQLEYLYTSSEKGALTGYRGSSTGVMLATAGNEKLLRMKGYWIYQSDYLITSTGSSSW